MKLPEMPDIKEAQTDGNVSEFELAQLHCLRSIAVNLEVLAISATDDYAQNERLKMVLILESHSVSKISL